MPEETSFISVRQPDESANTYRNVAVLLIVDF